MHEMGIILHIAKMLDETAEEQHITKIGSVTLEVGEVSGYCHSEETWLVDGNQCVIKEIEAECEEDDLEEEGFEEDPDDDDLDYRAGDFAENE